MHTALCGMHVSHVLYGCRHVYKKPRVRAFRLTLSVHVSHLVVVGEDVAGRALAVVDASRAEAGHHAAAAAGDEAADGVGEAPEEGRLHAGGQGGVGLRDVHVLLDGLWMRCETVQ